MTPASLGLSPSVRIVAVRRRDRCRTAATWHRRAQGELALVDERADVFGLGAILCEILTGRPRTSASTLAMVRSAPGRLGPTWAMPWIVWTRVVPSRSWSPWRKTASHPSMRTAPECRRSRRFADDLSPRGARTTQTSRAIERGFAGESSRRAETATACSCTGGRGGGTSRDSRRRRGLVDPPPPGAGRLESTWSCRHGCSKPRQN